MADPAEEYQDIIELFGSPDDGYDQGPSETITRASPETVGAVTNASNHCSTSVLDMFYAAVSQGDLESTQRLFREITDLRRTEPCAATCRPTTRLHDYRKKRTGIESKEYNLTPTTDKVDASPDKTSNNYTSCDPATMVDTEQVFSAAVRAGNPQLLRFVLQNLPFDPLRTGPRLLELALELRAAPAVAEVLTCGVDVDERVHGSYVRWGSLVSYTHPLHSAAAVGDQATLETLISHGANLDLPDSDGNTALMLACAGSNPDTVRLLLEAGADASLADTNYRSAQVIAASSNKTEFIELISACGAAVTEKMLLRACEIRSVNEHSLKLMLKAVPEDGVSINWYRLLCVAAHFRKPEIVEALLGRMPDSKKIPGRRAQDVLTSAVHNKSYGARIITSLLEEGFFDADRKDHHKERPLHKAVKCGSPAVCLVLGLHADVNARDADGRTALMMSLYRESREDTKLQTIIMQQLIAQGAHVNAQDTTDQRTCLHHAVKLNNVNAVDALVEAGADVSIRDSQGLTPLDSTLVGNAHLHLYDTEMVPVSVTTSPMFWEDEHGVMRFHPVPDLENQQRVMATLLRAGAAFTEEARQRWALHSLLFFGMDRLVPLVLGRGVFPQHAPPRKSHTDTTAPHLPRCTGSPFSFALYLGNVRSALSLYDNWFLTGMDLKLLNGNCESRMVIERVVERSDEKQEDASRRCLSLFSNCRELQLLSFVKVSGLIGPRDGREGKVRALGLPPVMQRRLLFTDVKF